MVAVLYRHIELCDDRGGDGEHVFPRLRLLVGEILVHEDLAKMVQHLTIRRTPVSAILPVNLDTPLENIAPRRRRLK